MNKTPFFVLSIGIFFSKNKETTIAENAEDWRMIFLIPNTDCYTISILNFK